jgi:hypothetical protein
VPSQLLDRELGLASPQSDDLIEFLPGSFDVTVLPMQHGALRMVAMSTDSGSIAGATSRDEKKAAVTAAVAAAITAVVTVHLGSAGPADIGLVGH